MQRLESIINPLIHIKIQILDKLQNKPLNSCETIKKKISSKIINNYFIVISITSFIFLMFMYVKIVFLFSI